MMVHLLPPPCISTTAGQQQSQHPPSQPVQQPQQTTTPTRRRHGRKTTKTSPRKPKKQFAVYPVLEEDCKQKKAISNGYHNAEKLEQYNSDDNDNSVVVISSMKKNVVAGEMMLNGKVEDIQCRQNQQNGHLCNGAPNGKLLDNGNCTRTTATTPKKPSAASAVSNASRRRRADTVEVPAVATPCAASSPERLGIRRCKVIMLGDSGVGKTSIVLSYKYGPTASGLVACNATIGASYTNFDLNVLNNVPVQLQLWDTAGQERFRCMVPMYMRNASAAILVYDITNRASFDQIERWHNEISRCPSTMDEPVVVLVGNKADQRDQREVAEGEGIAKALRLKARFFEISAIDAEVIRSIFASVAEQVVRRCADVDCAWEADESLSADDTDDRSRSGSGSSSAAGGAGVSPVIRLGWEPFRKELGEWARQLSCRSWMGHENDAEAQQKKKTSPPVKEGSCCAAL